MHPFVTHPALSRRYARISRDVDGCDARPRRDGLDSIDRDRSTRTRPSSAEDVIHRRHRARARAIVGAHARDRFDLEVAVDRAIRVERAFE